KQSGPEITAKAVRIERMGLTFIKIASIEFRRDTFRINPLDSTNRHCLIAELSGSLPHLRINGVGKEVPRL
ncbi:MAG: hypothetical protein ACKVKV_05685, partial [Dehalococcoidia bacterium]